jgi:hypothetical protein
MIVPFIDSVTATNVYLNPDFVMSLRPDPADPHRVTIVKLKDGETLRVIGEHTEVAEKLAMTPAV